MRNTQGNAVNQGFVPGRVVFVVATTLVALCSTPVLAQTGDPIVTDRPDFTESTVSVARGMLQLEGGYTIARADGLTNHSLGEVLLRLGIGGPFEFRVGLNSWLIADDATGNRHGLEDSSLGIKYEARRAAGPVPAIGIIAATSLPTGADSFTSDEFEPELILALGWDLAPGWTAGSNIGFLGGDIGSGADNQWIGSAVIGHGLSETLSAFAEVYGFSNGPADADVFVDGGVTVGLSDQLQLDLRLARQIGGAARETHVGIGIARRWRLLP